MCRHAFIAALLLPALALSAETIEFNRDIRPILSDKCFACHGPDPGNRKTKLRLDTEIGAKIALSGGRISIAPGDPAKSEVFRRMSSDNKAVRMPPAWAGARQAQRQKRSISFGTGSSKVRSGKRTGRSFRPSVPRFPPVNGIELAHNPIDHFVAQHLEAEGLKPSPEADRRTLIRRVTLDLTGLPPTPAEVDAFLNDTRRTLTKRLWTACSPRRDTPSAWRFAGWKPRAMPIPTAIKPTASAICGAGAIG